MNKLSLNCEFLQIEWSNCICFVFMLCGTILFRIIKKKFSSSINAFESGKHSETDRASKFANDSFIHLPMIKLNFIRTILTVSWTYTSNLISGKREIPRALSSFLIHTHPIFRLFSLYTRILLPSVSLYWHIIRVHILPLCHKLYSYWSMVHCYCMH